MTYCWGFPSTTRRISTTIRSAFPAHCRYSRASSAGDVSSRYFPSGSAHRMREKRSTPFSRESKPLSSSEGGPNESCNSDHACPFTLYACVAIMSSGQDANQPHGTQVDRLPIERACRHRARGDLVVEGSLARLQCSSTAFHFDSFVRAVRHLGPPRRGVGADTGLRRRPRRRSLGRGRVGVDGGGRGGRPGRPGPASPHVLGAGAHLQAGPAGDVDVHRAQADDAQDPQAGTPPRAPPWPWPRSDRTGAPAPGCPPSLGGSRRRPWPA